MAADFSPGAPDAVKLGCKCERPDPRLSIGLGNGFFFINPDCSIHGPTVEAART